MKRLIAILLACVLLLPAVPAVYAHEAPVISSNKDDHFYVNAQRWSTPICSALEVTKDGYLRVEYVGDQLVVEKYDRDFNFVSGETLELELPIYGGVYLGEDCNVLVVGQMNLEEDNSKEVFRIIRYSKDWVRQGSASIYGANTTIPFDAGSLRFARSGDILYIRTAHEMYADENEVNHQANVMISVRLSNMTVTDQQTEVLSGSYGYVSHSFNQFVLVDGNTLLAVDHGDYYPRSVVLFKYRMAAGGNTFHSRASAVNALPIVSSSYHYNDTGVSVGGFQASSSHYLIAGCSADQTEVCDLMEAHRNIFVTATPKDNFTDDGTTVRWLTSYEETDNVVVSPPHLVKLSADRFFLIWTENGQIRYCTLNGKGEQESEIHSAEGDLSDCVPIVEDGKVIWYVTNFTEPKFYVIDPDNPVHTHSYTAVVTASTCTQGGFTTYTCQCGDSYIADETDPTGHTMVNGTCSACGETASEMIRIAGADRYTTAFLTADQLKAKLGISKFNTIVVASGTDFADALSGSYLAAVKGAPMLLVRNRDQEITAVKDYIKANLVPGGTVYLLGGEKAVPKAMESGLEGIQVKRLGGATRYATNLLILEEAGISGKDVLVCTGKGFADSLSASAAKQPILLVKDNLDNDQKNFLSKVSGKIYIIGGSSAVSTRIENQLKTYGTITRLGGATRYVTSVMVAETFFENPKYAVLAYSENFPDGLSGGALACGIDAPLILVKGGKGADAAGYTRAKGIQSGYVLGGTGLISDATVNTIFGQAAGTPIPAWIGE